MLDTSGIKILVFDEADQMLKVSLIRDVFLSSLRFVLLSTYLLQLSIPVVTRKHKTCTEPVYFGTCMWQLLLHP